MESEREILIDLLKNLRNDDIQIEQGKDLLRDALVFQVLIPNQAIWELNRVKGVTR